MAAASAVPPAAFRAPWRQVINPFTPLEILSADQGRDDPRCREDDPPPDIGVEVLGAAALDRFERAGVKVERETGARSAAGRVRINPDQLEALIAHAPPRFELQARNPERSVVFGDRHLVFASVGGPAFVSDLDGGRRPGTSADLERFVRVIGALDVIHQEGGGPLEALDLPAETRHLDLYRTLATNLDKPWQCSAFGRGAVEDGIEVAAITLGVDRDELARSPALMTIVNTNSPLRLDEPMSDGLIAMAEAGQATVATPFTLAGAMTPATLAGALAQQHAEALFMVALAQLVRPGAPMVYGGFTSNVDMRTGSPAFGTPEYVKAQLATGQLARRVKLPWRTSNVTASSTVDAQAAYESEMSVWGALTGGASLLYQGAGWLEGGLTASFEKLVLDAELLAQIAEVCQPIAVDEDTLGLAAIAEVGPGGHFFGTAHTLARFETAFYRPMLSDWRNFETWSEDGAQTATQRANRIWKQLAAEYEPPPLDPARAEALDAFIDRRKHARSAAADPGHEEAPGVPGLRCRGVHSGGHRQHSGAGTALREPIEGAARAGRPAGFGDGPGADGAAGGGGWRGVGCPPRAGATRSGLEPSGPGRPAACCSSSVCEAPLAGVLDVLSIPRAGQPIHRRQVENRHGRMTMSAQALGRSGPRGGLYRRRNWRDAASEAGHFDPDGRVAASRAANGRQATRFGPRPGPVADSGAAERPTMRKTAAPEAAPSRPAAHGAGSARPIGVHRSSFPEHRTAGRPPMPRQEPRRRDPHRLRVRRRVLVAPEADRPEPGRVLGDERVREHPRPWTRRAPAASPSTSSTSKSAAGSPKAWHDRGLRGEVRHLDRVRLREHEERRAVHQNHVGTT
ncbi:MAG: trimethylamine methyltransferase family protein [Chloroflexota bacterium]